MAWKTGTSYGHRDAWTIAYTPAYTVGVWMGNVTGRPSKALIGIEAAAPVAARILDRLSEESPGWYAAPRGVARVELCAASGLPPGPRCVPGARDLRIVDRAPRETCAVHQEVRVDAGTGTRVCAGCAPGRECARQVVECWPLDVAAWLKSHEPRRPLVPDHLPGCARASGADAPPRILAPAAGQSYVLEEGDGDATSRLMLKAAARTGRLHWFVDGTYVAATASLEPLFWPLRRGAHTILCAGDSGRSHSVGIVVR
jgi:penicillin-binding protein 1C